jgi:hypothetical protein
MRRIQLGLRAVVTILALFALASVALAQASANYDLSWHVIAGGGRRMEGGSHVVLGTAGQPMAGTMSGSGHTLDSGFWGRRATTGQEHDIYLPVVLREG